MFKKITAIVLCLLMICPVLVSCGEKMTIDSEDKGAYIHTYLADQIYDFDPLYAYGNDSALKIISLMFEPLFSINEKGKRENVLVEKYQIIENEAANEYKIILTLRDSSWNDNTPVSAEDVIFAFERALGVDYAGDVAALLFDIKNARKVKEGDLTIDDLGVSSSKPNELEITLEGKIDYEHFLNNLASLALAPVRKDIVERNPGDWAKKPATIVCSGPFRLTSVSYNEEDKGLILERNAYYRRDPENDALDKFVKPYKIIVDYTKTAEQQLEMFDNGEIFYVGDIALDKRSAYANSSSITIKDALSTVSALLNENTYIGELLYEYEKSEKATSTRVTTDHKYTFIKYVGDAEIDPDSSVSIDLTTPAEVITGTDPETGLQTVDRYFYGYTQRQGGKQIFANSVVRNALSSVIDRQALAEAVVFASAAYALVPYGVYDATSSSTLFRNAGQDYLDKTVASADAAREAIVNAGINPAEHSFYLSVKATDEVHCLIAETICTAWNAIGFNVEVKYLEMEVNDEIGSTGEVSKDIRDDIHAEALASGDYDAIIFDLVAKSTDAFSVLAPFAKGFTGMSMPMDVKDPITEEYIYEIPTHLCGYNSEEYNQKIEAAFAEKDISKRATLLHEAEQILMKDLPIIPILYNKTAYLLNTSLLSKVTFNYYGNPNFTDARLKDYHQYIPETAAE